MGLLFIMGPKGLKNNRTKAKPAKTNSNADCILTLGCVGLVLVGGAGRLI